MGRDEIVGSAPAGRVGGLARRHTRTPLRPAVAAEWARLTAGARGRGRPRPANDTWVAACSLAYDLALVTMNRKDFEDFERYHGLVLQPPG